MAATSVTVESSNGSSSAAVRDHGFMAPRSLEASWRRRRDYGGRGKVRNEQNTYTQAATEGYRVDSIKWHATAAVVQMQARRRWELGRDAGA
jgi:hypothetical protein